MQKISKKHPVLGQKTTYDTLSFVYMKGSDEDKTTEGTYSYIFYSNAESSGISKVLADDNTIDWDGNEVTLAKSADITVYTAAGAAVKSAKNVKSLSLADAAHGIYLVKVGKQALKIVK